MVNINRHACIHKFVCLKWDAVAVNNNMAETGVRQVLEKEVTCPLCLDLFKDPKKLPCDHVYCKDCLRGLALRSLNATISCPECRTLTQAPGNDVNNFLTAFRINRFVEAFQKVNLQVEVDSPSVCSGEVCQTHPTQPFAIYCETCHKHVCRDCVLMTKEHTYHKYGFYEEVSPKYRRILHRELSLVKNQEMATVNALKEIEAAEKSVASHARICQDSIDHAFEEMSSILLDYKTALKQEASEHYESLTGIFREQTNQVKEIHNELREISTSADHIMKADDQNFLKKANAVIIEVKMVQQKLRSAPMIVNGPELLGTKAVATSSLLKFMKANCHLYKLPDPKKCALDEAFQYELNIDQQSEFILTLNDARGNICQGGEDIDNIDIAIVSHKQGSATKGNTELLSPGRIKISITPKMRGRYVLNVKVNGAHIKNSPFTVMVSIPPRLLSQPVAVICGLDRPASLMFSDRRVLVTEVEKHKISGIDCQHFVKQSKMKWHHPFAGKLTQDADVNLYLTTTDHKLHKLSKNGRRIKTIGQHGSKESQFNLPNGLRVSKESELYVCDSYNHRIQVFDLDLNFKRSFGKRGTRKGQFDFPSDIDFDSNGCIYIADHFNHRIQVFESSESHISTIGSTAIKFRPVSILIQNNQLYITDQLNGCILVTTLVGEIVAMVGGGHLSNPEGITIDEDGYVYVTSQHSKIVVF